MEVLYLTWPDAPPRWLQARGGKAVMSDSTFAGDYGCHLVKRSARDEWASRSPAPPAKPAGPDHRPRRSRRSRRSASIRCRGGFVLANRCEAWRASVGLPFPDACPRKRDLRARAVDSRSWRKPPDRLPHSASRAPASTRSTKPISRWRRRLGERSAARSVSASSRDQADNEPTER